MISNRATPNDWYHEQKNNFPTIILTQGLLSTPCIMKQVGDGLREVFNVVYSPGFHRLSTVDICRSSNLLRKKLEPILNKEQNEVVMMGHSLGGLIGLDLLRHWKPARNKVSKFIACATPFQGTKLALIGKPFSKACEQLIPGSEYLENLNKKLAYEINGIQLELHLSMKDQFLPVESQQPADSNGLDIELRQHQDFKHLDFVIGEKSKLFVRELLDRNY